MNINEVDRICKTKNCNNIVLKGKICRNCAQLRKDRLKSVGKKAVKSVQGAVGLVVVIGGAIKIIKNNF